MPISIPPAWRIPEREVTDERFLLSRREALAKGAALASAIASGAVCSKRAFGEPTARLYRAPAGTYPAARNARFEVKERTVTPEALASSYNNFYEFTETKEEVKNEIGLFETDPWTVEISGLCHKPQKLSLDEIVRSVALEERIYRFRCVEAWAMTVPWTGFPLRLLLDRAQPFASAKYVRFVSFMNESWAPGQAHAKKYPWPYFEALEIAEAANELTMVVTGAYGKDLQRQSGAPIRLIVPWKYGYKSPKSIVKIELVEERPETFWHKQGPGVYGFSSNVDPTKPHPRWSQRSERLIDTGERVLSQAFNGYGAFVAHLYWDRDDKAQRYF
jgi:methionine sulfoxide reductase catalytic subunit